MTGARRRLDELARLITPVGCPACRHRAPVAVRRDGGDSRPEACPAGGRTVPIQGRRGYVGIRWADV